ncbi:type II methionyl aminopeptidase [Candidatus Woesearchaeota archaeon]|nr:type II methionyl aminopeptidase [Candidatus Woesearchaeota archaeon]
MTSIDDWRKAGKLAAQALEYGKGLIKPGAKLIDVADAVDNKIRELGAAPAWPTQLSMDAVAAHYTADPGEETVFKEQLVSLDVGVVVDGAIGDNAVTVDLSGRHGNIVKAAEDALAAAIKEVRVGAKLSDIGKAIQDAIQSAGLVPIRNLSGHTISPWIIHDQPSIPNVAVNDKTVLVKGQVIAIEPFATNGAGFVQDEGRANLFALIDDRPVRSQTARQVFQFIVENYRNLPFTTRWLTPVFGPGRTQLALRELMMAGNLREHPPLVEAGKGLVAVHEKTLLVEDEVEILTQA